MADELDSGSSVGYYVWVQVPSSALYEKSIAYAILFFRAFMKHKYSFACQDQLASKKYYVKMIYKKR